MSASEHIISVRSPQSAVVLLSGSVIVMAVVSGEGCECGPPWRTSYDSADLSIQHASHPGTLHTFGKIFSISFTSLESPPI